MRTTSRTRTASGLWPLAIALLLTAAGDTADRLAAQAANPSSTLADRILAVVDEDPILASDLQRAIGIGLIESRNGEGERAFHRRVLDGLIEQRLRFHEVDRFGFTEVPAAEIDAQVAMLRESFASEEGFQARLRELNLDRTALREILARQLMILAYVEERLGARVFVALADIQSYYNEELTPEMQRQGVEPPPLPSVREEIRALLRERRLNEEIDRWTQELRESADVLDYLDREHEGLPPVVRTIDATRPDPEGANARGPDSES
jgi:hypothetical protein